jgi:hypothetical protein
MAAFTLVLPPPRRRLASVRPPRTRRLARRRDHRRHEDEQPDIGSLAQHRCHEGRSRPAQLPLGTNSDRGRRCDQRSRFVWAAREQTLAQRALFHFVQTRRATGRRAGRSHCASERKPRPVPRLGSLTRARQARRGRSARRYPVRRGADDSGGGVSPTHRGRARSARRSRASRTSGSRSGPARCLR